jgi:hypothetical protein
MCSFHVRADHSLDEVRHLRLAARHRLIEQGESARVQRDQDALEHRSSERFAAAEVVMDRARIRPRLTHDLAERSGLDSRVGKLGFSRVKKGVNLGAGHVRGSA